MATYKVIQDIEAEDKLIGALSLRQFIYATITASSLFICYMALSRMGTVGLGVVILFLPIALFFGFLAFPWGKDQPTELWALARINFLYRPRKRFWDQAGMRELVTITAPKRVERAYTDGLSENEVRSRLQALASTLDSRGWAVKGPSMNPYMAPAFATTSTSEDRLVTMDNMPHEVPTIGEEVYADMLDPTNNRVAQQFASMLDNSAKTHRQQLISSLQAPVEPPVQQTPLPAQMAGQGTPSPDYWFLSEPTGTVKPGMLTFDAQVVTPGAGSAGAAQRNDDDDEQALVEALKAKEQAGPPAVYAHLPTILPLAEQERLAREAAEKAAAEAAAAIPPPSQTPWDTSSGAGSTGTQKQAVTDEADAAILDLSRNDDLNIETLARQAKKAHEDEDEVVVSLH